MCCSFVLKCMYGSSVSCMYIIYIYTFALCILFFYIYIYMHQLNIPEQSSVQQKRHARLFGYPGGRGLGIKSRPEAGGITRRGCVRRRCFVCDYQNAHNPKPLTIRCMTRDFILALADFLAWALRGRRLFFDPFDSRRNDRKTTEAGHCFFCESY